MDIATEAAFKDDDFYQREAWPLALVIAGILCLVVGLTRNLNGELRLFEPETGEDVIAEIGNHTVFIVKMHWCGPILLVFAAITYIHRVAEENLP